MKFEVTKERIARSRRGNASCCAVATAIRDALPQVDVIVYPNADLYRVAIGSSSETCSAETAAHFCTLNPEISMALRVWDRGGELEPFDFEMPIEQFLGLPQPGDVKDQIIQQVARLIRHWVRFKYAPASVFDVMAILNSYGDTFPDEEVLRLLTQEPLGSL